jgi:PPOX class probable F420-dependent enzyme
MPTATIPESHRDLLTPATVALSTANADGSIQTTAVWVLLGDDGVLRMSLATDRQKYRNLVRDPHATVFALDPTNPFRFLEVRATVTIAPDDDKSFVREVFSAYDTDLESMPGLLDEDRVIVTFDLQRVIAQ